MPTTTIWDLKPGDRFRVTEAGPQCEVVFQTEDGKGLVAKYIDGDLEGQQDFVFDEEIDYDSIVRVKV